MIRYTTQSGSVYEVLGVQVRRVLRSRKSGAERVGHDWRTAESVVCKGIGHPLVIVWGTGRDEYSDRALQVGFADSPDATVVRSTQTSPVTAFAVVKDPS